MKYANIIGLGYCRFRHLKLLESQAIVPPPNISGKGGLIADILLYDAYNSTNIVEIKTHNTPLFKKGKREISDDVHSAILQLRDYMYSFDENGRKLLNDGGECYGDMKVIRPEGYLIIGAMYRELEGSTPEQRKDRIEAFEKFRKGLSDIKIITYEEIGARTQIVRGF